MARGPNRRAKRMSLDKEPHWSVGWWLTAAGKWKMFRGCHRRCRRFFCRGHQKLVCRLIHRAKRLHGDWKKCVCGGDLLLLLLLLLYMHVWLPAPTVKTFSKSAHIAICLYSCGDCARYALRLKYVTSNTLAPPSEAAVSIITKHWSQTNCWISYRQRAILQMLHWHYNAILWTCVLHKGSSKMHIRIKSKKIKK